MAIVAECFLPEVNGVNNSVLRVVEQLEALGHTTLVIAPGLGAAAGRACRRLEIPSVAVYQTDLAAFARPYRMGWAGAMVWSWLHRVHESVDLTLAPSTLAAWELRNHGIAPVAGWSPPRREAA